MLSIYQIFSDPFIRVLMSCIKFLAKCMCPRCESLKSKIPQVGSKTDMRSRLKLTRLDNDARQYDIELVRKMMFEKGINITSVKIDRILGPTSSVPTRVCVFSLYCGYISQILHRMPFPNALVHPASIFINYLLLISFTKSSLVFGRHFLHI